MVVLACWQASSLLISTNYRFQSVMQIPAIRLFFIMILHFVTQLYAYAYVTHRNGCEITIKNYFLLRYLLNQSTVNSFPGLICTRLSCTFIDVVYTHTLFFFLRQVHIDVQNNLLKKTCIISTRIFLVNIRVFYRNMGTCSLLSMLLTYT